MTLAERELVATNAARTAHPVFVANGWTYGLNEQSHPPTVEDLANAVKRLIANTTTAMLDHSRDEACSSTGRFSVVQDRTGLEVSLSLVDIEFNPA